jgi:hypothetical protein
LLKARQLPLHPRQRNLCVRVGICVTEGKVLEVEEEILEVGDEEG